MNHEIINNELSEDTKLLISKVELIEEDIDNTKKELSKKDKEIENLKNEIVALKGIISTSNRKVFGISS